MTAYSYRIVKAESTRPLPRRHRRFLLKLRLCTKDHPAFGKSAKQITYFIWCESHLMDFHVVKFNSKTRSFILSGHAKCPQVHAML
jgi:hypothetical protein